MKTNKLNLNIINDDEILEYVLKVDNFEIQKLEKIINPIVCLYPSPMPNKTSNQIIFVNQNYQEIGTAKLLKIITAPKQKIWSQIEPYTIINKCLFDKLYKNKINATIAVIYDFILLSNPIQLEIDKIQFYNWIGFYKIKK